MIWFGVVCFEVAKKNLKKIWSTNSKQKNLSQFDLFFFHEKFDLAKDFGICPGPVTVSEVIRWFPAQNEPVWKCIDIY